MYAKKPKPKKKPAQKKPAPKRPRAASGLTPKQQAFVREYLIDLNATAAYKRAGYLATGRAAENNASRLLGNAGVREAIATGMASRSKRTEVEADHVLQELAAIAFSDVGQVLDFAGDKLQLRNPSEIPDAARRAIASIKVKRSVEGTGELARDVEVTEFKLWSKDAALHKLGLHLGLFPNRHEHTGADGGPVPIQIIEAAQAAPVQTPALPAAAKP